MPQLQKVVTALCQVYLLAALMSLLAPILFPVMALLL